MIITVHVHSIEMNLIIFLLFLNEFVCVGKFWKLYFFCFYDKRSKFPFSPVFVPLGFLLNFVHLLIVHKESGYLI